MDSHVTAATTPSIGSTLPILDDYVVGPQRERRPAADLYDAVHRRSGAAHVLYVLRPRAMQDHALVHRVGCEVDAARWLRHPAIPKLAPQGETPSRRLYVAVERPAGRTLRAIVTDGGPVAPQDLVRIAAPVVEALEEVHAVGLTHGRLTPDTVVVAGDGTTSPTARVTLTGVGLATVARPGEFSAAELPFISPEQRAGDEPDARSDVFGLAALLAYALHGDPRAAAFPSADGVRMTDHPTLARVLATAQSADRALRPASVKLFWEEVLAALVSAAPLVEVAARTAVDAQPAAVPTPDAAVPATRRRRHPARAHAWWLAVPVAAAFGWPLASSAARSRTLPPPSSRADAGVRPATPGSVTPGSPTLAGAHGRADGAGRGTDPTETRSSAGSEAPSRPQAAAERTADAKHSHPSPRNAGQATADRRDSAVQPAKSVLPRIDVPTIIVIMNGEQRPRTATPTRPGEFDNDISRTLRTP